MSFNDFDIEIQDETGNIPEQINGSVTTAGVPVTITSSVGKITSIQVYNPRKGSNANAINDVLLVSFDNVTYISVPRGETVGIDGIYIDTISIDANNNSVNYEVILTHDS